MVMRRYLGYPGRWWHGDLYEEGGLPVHLYPMLVTVRGEGPADPEEAFRAVCWCPFEGCVGTSDELGFPRA